MAHQASLLANIDTLKIYSRNRFILTPGYSNFFLTNYFFILCKEFTFVLIFIVFFLTIGSFLPFFAAKK